MHTRVERNDSLAVWRPAWRHNPSDLGTGALTRVFTSKMVSITWQGAPEAPGGVPYINRAPSGDQFASSSEQSLCVNSWALPPSDASGEFPDLLTSAESARSPVRVSNETILFDRPRGS